MKCDEPNSRRGGHCELGHVNDPHSALVEFESTPTLRIGVHGYQATLLQTPRRT